MIKEYITEGKIVPMEVTIKLLENAMRAAMSSEAGESKEAGAASGVKGIPARRFLVDGFPRQMDQAVKFDDTVCPSSLVLFLVCPETILQERLLERGKTSGRDDDNAASIKKRFGASSLVLLAHSVGSSRLRDRRLQVDLAESPALPRRRHLHPHFYARRRVLSQAGQGRRRASRPLLSSTSSACPDPRSGLSFSVTLADRLVQDDRRSLRGHQARHRTRCRVVLGAAPPRPDPSLPPYPLSLVVPPSLDSSMYLLPPYAIPFVLVVGSWARSGAVAQLSDGGRGCCEERRRSCAWSGVGVCREGESCKVRLTFSLSS